MSKRITLNKLISYMLSTQDKNIKVKNSEEEEYEIKIEDNMEKIVFDELDYGSTKKVVDVPKNIRRIIDPFLTDITRHGIIKVFENKDINISLFFSVLYTIDDKFTDLTVLEQEVAIESLLRNMIYDIDRTDIFEKNSYSEYGWKKVELKEALKNYVTNKMVIQYLADFLNLNIFILNSLPRFICDCQFR